jgi:hypothetical protein
MSRGKDLIKLALITIVTAILEQMRTFYVRDLDGNVINVHMAVEEPSR